MAEKVFKGRTEDAEAPFLNAKFWRKGMTVAGVVERSFVTENGNCFVLHSLKPIQIDGEETDRFSIGGMAGFRMALQAAGVDALRLGDRLFIECTGETPAVKEGNSPRVNFAVELTRQV
jgi:hypothetical protein